MVEIADFVPHAPVPAEIVEEYRGRVPDELIEVWENYGYGTFAEGFLRIIDPKLYEAEVGDCIGKTQGDGIAIPIMVTGLDEVMDWPAVSNPKNPSYDRLWGMIGATLAGRGVVEGHGSGLRDIGEINAFAAAGLASDHEVQTPEETWDKLLADH